MSSIPYFISAPVYNTEKEYTSLITGKEASIPLSLEVCPSQEAATSSELSFAAGVAAYGMILRESPYLGGATFDMALELAQEGLSFDPFGYRADFVDIISKAKKIAGK